MQIIRVNVGLVWPVALTVDCSKDNLSNRFQAGGGYEMDVDVDKVCNGLGIFFEQRWQIFSSLSGGEKTRVNLARLLLEETEILLLDEPTAALDLVCKQKIASYLRHYKENGGILLLTTHDVMELDLCDVWYIIRDGVLEPYQYDGNLRDLIESL